MNYSYVNSDDVKQTKETSKNRYKVNSLVDQCSSMDEINAFRQFRKFNKFKKIIKFQAILNMKRKRKLI